MHELGTIKYIIDTVEKLCEKNALTTVASVTVEIGEVSGILTGYLLDCWKFKKHSYFRSFFRYHNRSFYCY